MSERVQIQLRTPAEVELWSNRMVDLFRCRLAAAVSRGQEVCISVTQGMLERPSGERQCYKADGSLDLRITVAADPAEKCDGWELTA